MVALAPWFGMFVGATLKYLFTSGGVWRGWSQQALRGINQFIGYDPDNPPQEMPATEEEFLAAKREVAEKMQRAKRKYRKQVRQEKAKIQEEQKELGSKRRQFN